MLFNKQNYPLIITKYPSYLFYWQSAWLSSHQSPHRSYRKNPKISDTWKFVVITLKVEQDGLFLGVMHPEDAAGIANSVDPDETAQSDLGLHCLPRPDCSKT